MNNNFLEITGEVARPLKLTREQLAAVASQHQVLDVSQLDSRRRGKAVKLAGLLELAEVSAAVQHLGLHASKDDFHASIPLTPIRDTAVLIYELDGEPLPVKAGGPFRFFIPNHAACGVHEIDECANVKFVDRIELTATKGFDNRPADEAQHAALHQK